MSSRADGRDCQFQILDSRFWILDSARARREFNPKSTIRNPKSNLVAMFLDRFARRSMMVASDRTRMLVVGLEVSFYKAG
jgi:hypothetical protein